MKKLCRYVALVAGCGLLGGAGAPAGQLTKSQYKPGHYTLTSGVRRAAQLRSYVSRTDFLTKIEVEPSAGTVPLVLGPAELRSAVIGPDSMVALRLTELNDTATTVTDLAHVVMVGKATLLMRREQVVGAPGVMMSVGPYGVGMVTGSGDGVLTRWAYQKAGAARGYLLPWADDAFQKQVAPLFFDFPHLCQRIRSGEASRNDVKRIFYAYNLRAEFDEVSYEQAEAACRYLVFK